MPVVNPVSIKNPEGRHREVTPEGRHREITRFGCDSQNRIFSVTKSAKHRGTWVSRPDTH